MYVDRRLAGIQAVQTLSRLNRAYPGKDTTYVLDFVNEPSDILASFKVYYETAQLETTTDPNLVLNLRAKLDGQGHYDDFEVDRVAKVELDPASTQGDLLKAIEPVVDRLMKQFAAAKKAWVEALDAGNEADAKKHKDAMDALILFRSDLGAYVRLYTFLSQIFNYENTDLEKRAIFYRRLIATARIRQGAGRHRSVEDQAISPRTEEAGRLQAGSGQGRGGEAATPDRRRQRRSAGQGQGRPIHHHPEGQ